MAKRRTALQREYDKAYRNLQHRIRNIENRGYVVGNILPKQVKRPTRKSIEKLNRIKAPEIYAKSKAVNPETGEIITARERQKLDRRRAAQKAAETRRKNLESTYPEKMRNVSRETLEIEPTKSLPPLPSYGEIIVGNFKAEMARMPGDNGSRIIGFINDLINKEGLDAVATMLEEANNAGKMPNYGFLASGQEDLVIDALGEMLEFLPDVSESFKRDVIEDFEYHEGGY